jgi:L-fuconate dehydratase
MSSVKITNIRTEDIRFPTSREMDGSDAMNLGDYSAAYVIIETDTNIEGHGLTFTNGRGNDLVTGAVHALKHHLIGKSLDEITGDFRKTWRSLTQDNQLRWLGPEKGIIHMATGATINAVWDLWAKRENKPVWKLVADMTPEQIVSVIDFSYITDALTPEEALQILKDRFPTRKERESEMLRDGFPGYTTSTGWLGYSDEKVRSLCRKAISEGWKDFKIKVGYDLEGDRRRAALMREEIGPDAKLMIDANQCWNVDEAIRHIKGMADFNLWWAEEPTCPDDVLGHAAIQKAVAPIRIATGEVCQNRVMFKQFLQAGAIGICQVDSCRTGGMNEVLPVLLMARKFGVPVCPHTGGVGLCEYAQHISILDYICISGTLENRMLEYIDHLHEHFIDPVRVKNGRYLAPSAPGYSIGIKPESRKRFSFPDGEEWKK